MTSLERVLVSILEIGGTGVLILIVLPLVLYWAWLALKLARITQKEMNDE